MTLRRVTATRYVTPLREGGSLPGLVEADDLGTYVVKFRGAGQGRKALVAEVVTGELGRRLGLPVPELVVVRLDARMAVAEPDQEVQDLLRASGGDNLGMDFLPGSLGLEQPGDTVDADLAARILWFDALTQNVDRSWRNPNLLRWHGRPWLIDHGASLYFHHGWTGPESLAGAAAKPYPNPAEHVLLGVAGDLRAAHATLAPLVTPGLLDEITGLVPDDWIVDDVFPDPAEARQAYVDVLAERARRPDAWLDGVEVARAAAV
jgi:hypothetical protein